MPLIVETLILFVIAYLLGVGLAALLLGTRRRDSFLEE
jgi:hypothetical protein